jgi:hypothetical protein
MSRLGHFSYGSVRYMVLPVTFAFLQVTLFQFG